MNKNKIIIIGLFILLSLAASAMCAEAITGVQVQSVTRDGDALWNMVQYQQNTWSVSILYDGAMNENRTLSVNVTNSSGAFMGTANTTVAFNSSYGIQTSNVIFWNDFPADSYNYDFWIEPTSDDPTTSDNDIYSSGNTVLALSSVVTASFSSVPSNVAYTYSPGAVRSIAASAQGYSGATIYNITFRYYVSKGVIPTLAINYTDPFYPLGPNNVGNLVGATNKAAPSLYTRLPLLEDPAGYYYVASFTAGHSPPIYTLVKRWNVSLANNLVYYNQGIWSASDPTLAVQDFNNYMSNPKICTQEFANISTACGGLNTGVSSVTEGGSFGYWQGLNNVSNLYDGDWSTYSNCSSGSNCQANINYTIPTNSIGATWQVKDWNSTFNITIPANCWNTSKPLQLRFDSSRVSSDRVYYRCYKNDGSGTQTLATIIGGPDFYEEAVIWQIANPPQISYQIPVYRKYYSNYNPNTFVLDMTASSYNLTYANFTITNPSGTIVQSNQKSVSPNAYVTAFTDKVNVTGWAQGNYTITTFAKTSDASNNISNSSTWFYVYSPTINAYPLGSTYSMNLAQTLNCSVSNEMNGISNITLYVWNSSNSVIIQNKTAISGTSNSTSWLVNLPSTGTYKWGCLDTTTIGTTTFGANSTLYLGQSQPTYISDCTGLQNMWNNLSGNYKLISNIDCSATSTWNWNGSQYLGFSPVGNSTAGYQFTGSFDGQGFNITNLYINRNIQNTGLIGYAWNFSFIKDVGLININVTGLGNGAGTLLGSGYSAMATNSYISQCFSTGYLTAKGQGAGGLIGRIGATSTGNISLSKLYSSVTVFDIGNSGQGGLIGIVNTLTSTSNQVSITDSYATGNVIGLNKVGGLIGNPVVVGGGPIIINRSYSTGIVNATGSTGFAGGLLGDTTTPTLDSSFATGNVEGQWSSSSAVGPIEGNAGTVLNSYYYSGASCLNRAGTCNTIATGSYSSISSFYNTSNPPLSTWDFVNTWSSTGSSLPGMQMSNYGTDIPTLPSVTLNNPINGTSFISGVNNSITFNFTVLLGTGSVSNCSLWTNTSGSWNINQTLTSTIINNTVTNFNPINVSIGSYIWNIQCTDTTGLSAFASSNYNFIVTGTNQAGTSPNNTQYNTTYGSTDFSTISDFNNVSNLVLANSLATKIAWINNVNISGVNLDAAVGMGQGYAAINSTAIPSLNTSANLTFNLSGTGASCSSFRIYYASNYYPSLAQIISNGVIVARTSNLNGNCTDSTICQNIACSNGILTFKAIHFDGYGAGGDPPNVTLISPLNNTKSNQMTQTFSCNATGNSANITNISISLWNSTGSLVNNSAMSLLSYCYQETANVSTACGGLNTGKYSFEANNFSINYTKPASAISSSLWQVKHGSLSPYNITIPSACWSQTVLQFKIFSTSSTPVSTQPYCYNGTAWQAIGSYENGGAAGSTGGDFTDTTRMYDGDWSTPNFYWTGLSNWYYTSGVFWPSSYAKIYEEGMYWVTTTGNTNASTATLTVNNLSNGNYIWNCLAYDTNSQSSYAITNYSFTLNNLAPIVSLISPSNSTASNNFTQTYSCNATDTSNLQSLALNIWNSANSLIYSNTTNLTGLFNSTSWIYSVSSSDTYKWNCLATDDYGNTAYASANRTILLDQSPPSITLTLPLTNSINSWTVLLRSTVTDSITSVNSTWYEIRNGTNNITASIIASGTMNNMGSNIYNATFATNATWPYDSININSTNLTLIIYANDTLGNTVNASTYWTLDNTKPGIQYILPADTGLITGDSQTFNLNIYLTNFKLNYSNYTITNSSSAVIQTNQTNLSTPTFFWTDIVNLSKAGYNDGNFTLTTYARDSQNNSRTKTTWFYVDKTPPTVTLISPTNNYNSNSITQTFDCNSTDTFGVANTTLYIWNSSNILINTTQMFSTCYQETANVANSCGGLATGQYSSATANWVYVNYSKPIGSINTSLWQVKHGLIQTNQTYNITLSADCWNAYSDRLVLGMYSWQQDTGSRWETGSYCYNGTNWTLQGEFRSGVRTMGGSASSSSATNLYDGNWDSYAMYNVGYGWYTFSGTSQNRTSAYYEEAMYWKVPQQKTINLPSTGTYKWNCLAIDTNLNIGFASSNYTLNIYNAPAVNLISPPNITSLNTTQTFICNSTSLYGLTNSTLQIWNITSGSLYLQNTTLISGLNNLTSWTNTIVPGNYTWNCLTYDINGQSTYPGNRTIQLLATNITRFSQVPADITVTNIVPNGSNVTYYVDYAGSLTNLQLYYRAGPNTTNACWIYEGTNNICKANTWQPIDNNYTINGKYYNWYFDDNKILSAWYPMNREYTETRPPSGFTSLTNGANHWIKMNMTIQRGDVNWFELMINHSSVAGNPSAGYICNGTYNTGSPTTSTNCALLRNINTTEAPNHCHNEDGGYICDKIYSFQMNSSGYYNSVYFGTTNITAQLLVRGSTGTGNWQVFYDSNITNTSFISTNNGGTFSPAGVTYITHAHWLSSTDYWQYYLNATTTYESYIGQTYFDNIGITLLAPGAPAITSPNASTYDSNISINYTTAIPMSGYATISNYNIDLYNASGVDYVFIKNIRNNALNLSYLWNTSGEATGNYVIRVTSFDNNSLSAFSETQVFTISHYTPISSPVITNISINSPITLISGTTTTLYSLINITHPSGAGYINDSLVYMKIQTSNTTNRTFNCLLKDVDVLWKTYNCSTILYYFDGPGVENVWAFVTDTAGNNATNTTTATINNLDSITLSVGSIAFGSSAPGTNNISGTPQNINNTGNQNYANITLKAYTLALASGSAQMNATQFCVNSINSPTGCNTLINNTAVSIGLTLPKGNNSYNTSYHYANIPIGKAPGIYTATQNWIYEAS